MTMTMIRTSGLTKHFPAPGKAKSAAGSAGTAVENSAEKGAGRDAAGNGKAVVEAVRGLDLHVEEGELVALLGPNGAGKSTTLRMLTTLIAPTSGTAQVAGYDALTERADVRRRIGYIGQGNGAGHSQRGRDELVNQGRCYGMSIRAARRRASELIDSLNLGPVADRVVSSLSGGQRRRLDIAMGLIHAPALLFLDEPSTGLDPHNRANLQEHIHRLRAEHGTTIVLTTHYLDEADSMAERVIVIDHGRIIADDTPERLKTRLVGDKVTLTFDTEVTAGAASGRIRELAGHAEIEASGPTVRIRAHNGTRLVTDVIRGLDAVGLPPLAAEVSRPTLDDVFLHLTGHSLREGGVAADPTQLNPNLDRPEVAA